MLVSRQNLERYAAAVERAPDDPVARIALAEELYRAGDLDQAITHMEYVLTQHPRLAPLHRSELDMWRRHKQDRDVRPPVICHACHTEIINPTDMCPQCGAMFRTAAGFRQGMVRDGGLSKIARGWIVIGGVVFVCAFSLMLLPSIVAGPIILGAIIVGAGLFLMWVGGDLGRYTDE